MEASTIDIAAIATFLASGSAAAAVITQFVKGFFDKVVSSRFEPIVTQMILLVFCFVIAGGGIAWGHLPEFIKVYMVLMFAGGLSIYEVLSAVFVGKKTNG